MIVVAITELASGQTDVHPAGLAAIVLLAAAVLVGWAAGIRRILRVVLAADLVSTTAGGDAYRFVFAWGRHVTLRTDQLRGLRRIVYVWGMPTLRSYRLDTDRGTFYLPAAPFGERMRADIVRRCPQVPGPGVRKPYDGLRRHPARGD